MKITNGITALSAKYRKDDNSVYWDNDLKQSGLEFLILSIIEDKNGELWIGTENSLIKYLSHYILASYHTKEDAALSATGVVVPIKAKTPPGGIINAPLILLVSACHISIPKISAISDVNLALVKL